MNYELDRVQFSAEGSITANSNNTLLQLHTHTHTHLPAQQSAPQPIPLRGCPLPSKRFTGREQELDKMYRFFFEGKKGGVFVVAGMGGCGKTQLASQFVHDKLLDNEENKKFSPSMIFFIDATTTATLDEGFKAIAQSKGIGNTAKDALNWLARVDCPCFLLLDNADDPKIELGNYLPQSNKAHVLLTTRLHYVGDQYGGGDKKAIIHLQDLLEADAEDLLVKTAGLSDDQRGSASVLVKELHCNALAVVQAGAGIRVLHCTIEEYTEMFLERRTSLMDGKSDRVKPRDLDGYPLTVRTTYLISLAQLRNEPTTRSLLGLFGHLHHTGTTEELFRRAFIGLRLYEPEVPMSEEEQVAFSSLEGTLSNFSKPNGSWNSSSFRGYMGEILSLSLVSHSTPNGYGTHPLIGDALRHDHPDFLPTAFLLGLAFLASDGNRDPYLHALAPHAERVLASCNEATLHPHIARGLGMICMYHDQGRTSEFLLKSAIDRCRQELSEESTPVMRLFTSLAILLESAGRYEQAERIWRQMLDRELSTCSRAYCPVTGALLKTNISGTLLKLGRYSEAEKISRQALEELERNSIVSLNQRSIAKVMFRLAEALRHLGRYSEAEHLQRQVLEKFRSLLGPDHALTVQIMNHLGVTLAAIGRHEEALTIMRQVLEKRSSSSGLDHPDTMEAMRNVAAILSGRGDLKEAEQIESRVLQRVSAFFGPSHRETVHAMANLAVTYSRLGRYEEAQQMQEQILSHYTSALGPDHPRTIKAMDNLAATLSRSRQYDQALQMQKKALAKTASFYGDDHPDTGRVMGNLSIALRHSGVRNEAQEWMDRALDVLSKSLGQDHPTTRSFKRDALQWRKEDEEDMEDEEDEKDEEDVENVEIEEDKEVEEVEEVIDAGARGSEHGTLAMAADKSQPSLSSRNLLQRTRSSLKSLLAQTKVKSA